MNQRIILVDALNLIYRAYYAVSGLATAAGRPTNAVFGFAKMVSQINRVWRPTHELVVFDGGVPAERLGLLGSYKAQRPPMPPALRGQMADIEEYLESAGIKSVRMEGKEADDIIATAAVLSVSTGFEVIVASSDKDLMQIAGNSIALVAPGKIEFKIGPEEVVKKTGVRPDQVVDWLALVGDSADNIPGVPGVGEKTSARLIAEWGSVAELYRNLGSVNPEKLRSRLEASRENVYRNVQLITLNRDLQLPCRPEDAPVAAPDPVRLRAFYEKMEFHSLVATLPPELPLGRPG